MVSGHLVAFSVGVVVQVMEKMISNLIAKLLACFWDSQSV